MLKRPAISGWLAVAILPSLVLAGIAPAQPSTAPAAPTPAAVVEFRDEVNSYSTGLLRRRIEQARRQGAKVVIIDMDTYGGQAQAALLTSQYLKTLDDLHTIAYVNPKAYSAGIMISMACNEIIMAPVAFIGDSAPIMPGATLEGVEREKAESPLRADFRDSAMRNGYDPLLAEAMVTMEREVWWVEKDGVRRFVDGEEYHEIRALGWQPVRIEGVPNPVDSAKTLLTVNTDLAVKLGLAKGMARSIEELASQRNYQIVATFRSGTGEMLISLLASSAARAIFLTIFMITLYMSLHTPGHGYPEVICVMALAGLLGIPALTGYAQWWEIVAVLVGIGLLAVEVFVLPGFGIAGLSGLALIVGGLLMTFAAPEPGGSPFSWPNLPATWDGLTNGLIVIVSGLCASILLGLWLRRYLPRLPMANRMILTTVVGTESAMVGSLTNIDPLDENPAVGATGVAVTDLRPGGSAQFRDAAGGTHVISVVSDSGFIPRGTTLMVREVAGNRVVVRAAAAPPANPPESSKT